MRRQLPGAALWLVPVVYRKSRLTIVANRSRYGSYLFLVDFAAPFCSDLDSVIELRLKEIDGKLRGNRLGIMALVSKFEDISN